MLDIVLGTKTNILVLRFLTKFNNQAFSAEEIIDETGASQKSVYRSLNFLVVEGIVRREEPYYKFMVDSKINNLIFSLFEEERKRFFFPTPFFKVLSEIESKIIKLVGNNLVDIFLFGSSAKGRATPESDIDICLLVKKKTKGEEYKIRNYIHSLQFSNEVQTHIFSVKEFLSSKKKKNQLIKNIIRDGISLKIGK